MGASFTLYVVLFYLISNIYSSLLSVHPIHSSENEMELNLDRFNNSLLSVSQIHSSENEMKLYWDKSNHTLHQFGVYSFNRTPPSLRMMYRI